MPPKRRPRGKAGSLQAYACKSDHPEKLGVRATACNASTKEMESIGCRLCASFDQEESVDGGPTAGTTRKGKRTTNNHHWRTSSFGSDIFQKHHRDEHSIRWQKYLEVMKKKDDHP